MDTRKETRDNYIKHIRSIWGRQHHHAFYYIRSECRPYHECLSRHGQHH